MNRPPRGLLPPILAGLLFTIGCNRQAPVPPAAREKPRLESELAYVTLPRDAYRSLGIEAQPMRTGPIQAHQELTGWVMARPGNEVTVTAPASGYVREASARTHSPAAGESVRPGDELFALEPVLSPVEQVQLASLKRGVETELTKARATLKLAENELQRTQDLHKQGLRGQQELEQAQVRVAHAREDLKAAQDKEKLFESPAVAIKAPRGGRVLHVHASPGQYVAAAAPLVTILDLDPTWIRIPVPEGDLAAVDASGSVAVSQKGATVPGNGARKGGPFAQARPVTRVPRVDPASRTADLIYELEPPSAKGQVPPALAKDQMLTIHLPLGQKRAESVVPYAAIIYDAFGGTWVYLERTKAQDKVHRFERRRVELGPPVEGGVIIRPRLSADERVVTAGAGALFSREFHHTGVGPPLESDDD